MTTGKRLIFGGLVLAGVTAFLAYLSMSTGWQYYATVDECLSGGSKLTGQRIRISGKVAANTLQIASDRKHAAFSLRGSAENLPVACTGILPDNLAENREVVVEGSMDDAGVFRCEKVMTQCASKYKTASTSSIPQ
jgi:cytochrome c-type biogenesis protein CcmE